MVTMPGTFVPALFSLPSLCDICLQETFALELLKLRAQVSKQTNISAQVLFSEGPGAIFEVVGAYSCQQIALEPLEALCCVVVPAPVRTENILAYRNNLFSGFGTSFDLF
jgi:hypothetical protein